MVTCGNQGWQKPRLYRKNPTRLGFSKYQVGLTQKSSPGFFGVGFFVPTLVVTPYRGVLMVLLKFFSNWLLLITTSYATFISSPSSRWFEVFILINNFK